MKHISIRKMVLFGAACRRHNWTLLEPEMQTEVEVQERFADGKATAEEVVYACEVYRGEGNGCSPSEIAPVRWAEGIADEEAEDAATGIVGEVLDAREETPWDRAYQDQRRVQCQLLRDVLGYPFRAVRTHRGWLTPTILRLAKAAYEERALPSGHLNPVRLGILADALEEAGCADGAILAHCRVTGPHVRGCWVVDRLLGNK
jgi:hypothetical protein